MQAVRPVRAGRRGQPAGLGAGVLTVGDAASLAAARRLLVVEAVRRLRAAYPANAATEGKDAVQGVRVVGRDAATVTTYGQLRYAVGDDAARYALVRTRHNRPVVVDLDVWSRRDERNPLVQVWSVVTRSSELVRTAAAYGVRPGGTLEGEQGDHTVRLAAALDTVAVAGRSAVACAEPHRLADQLEQVVPAHEAVLDEAHRELSTVRDDPAGDGAAAYRSRLSLLVRCAREVAGAVAALGPVAPERL